MIWDKRVHREERGERDRKIDELAGKLYEVALRSVEKDVEVHGVLESVRRDVEEMRRNVTRG